MDADAFRAMLVRWLSEAEAAGRRHLDVTSKSLHRAVGGYPEVWPPDAGLLRRYAIYHAGR